MLLQQVKKKFGEVRNIHGVNIRRNESLNLNWYLYVSDIETWVIHGHISFDKTPGMLPPKSCLKVTVWKSADYLKGNGHPEVIKTMTYSLGRVRVSKKYQYWLIIDRIDEYNLYPIFYLTATLNVGWCSVEKYPSKKGSVWRKGDYTMKKRKNLYLEARHNDYGENDLKLTYQKWK